VNRRILDRFGLFHVADNLAAFKRFAMKLATSTHIQQNLRYELLLTLALHPISKTSGQPPQTSVANLRFSSIPTRSYIGMDLSRKDDWGFPEVLDVKICCEALKQKDPFVDV